MDGVNELIADVVGVVEANSFEHMMLWQETHKKRKWVGGLNGILKTVGTLDDRPVCISINTDTIDGHRILFWYATSQVVDHSIIDKWLRENIPDAYFTDAMNFHSVFPR